MIRACLTLALAAAGVRSSLANLSGMGPFHPTVAVTWSATNELPPIVTIYKTVLTNFSQSVLSNIMSLASFKPVDIVSQNTNLIVFEGRLNNVLVRSLKISPTQGTIEYFETQTNYSTIHGVPSSDKTVNLAFNYLFMLSGDTNQVTPKAKAIREGTVETYNKPNGDMLSNKMYSRGTTLYRQLDGIQEKGSFMQIDFGNDAKVNYLSLHWRLLLPFKLCKTATADEIVGFINNGRSLIYLDPTGKNAAPVRAKTLTITKATPVYRTRNAPDFVLAFSDLEVVADIGTTNEESFYVCCPICPESE